MGVSGLTVLSPHLSEDAAAQPVVAPLIVGPDGALVYAMAAGGEAWLLSRTHEPLAHRPASFRFIGSQ